jgi:hypothetical protein
MVLLIRVTVTVISTSEFQLFTMIDRYSSKVNEFKMMRPLFFSDNTWFINITISKLQIPSTFHGVEEFMDSHSVSNR